MFLYFTISEECQRRDPDELTFVENSHLKYSKEVNDFVESDDCPTHYEYLRDYIYGGDELRAELI